MLTICFMAVLKRTFFAHSLCIERERFPQKASTERKVKRMIVLQVSNKQGEEQKVKRERHHREHHQQTNEKRTLMYIQKRELHTMRSRTRARDEEEINFSKQFGCCSFTVF